jgi:hypothetical protein
MVALADQYYKMLELKEFEMKEFELTEEEEERMPDLISKLAKTIKTLIMKAQTLAPDITETEGPLATIMASQAYVGAEPMDHLVSPLKRPGATTEDRGTDTDGTQHAGSDSDATQGGEDVAMGAPSPEPGVTPQAPISPGKRTSEQAGMEDESAGVRGAVKGTPEGAAAAAAANYGGAAAFGDLYVEDKRQGKKKKGPKGK